MSRLADAQRLPPGTVVGGRYEIRRFVGSGGSALVYAALDRRLSQEVALKVLRPDRSGPAAAARLHREVALARQVANPHVVRVHDIGEDEHGLFVTMEFVDGESLRERIERGALPVDEALRVALSLLEGLDAIHAAGIVHRDVKPSNVLVDSTGLVKIADLGIARSFDPEEAKVTATDAVVGTLEYLSPEQALGRPAETRSDLYSFGLLLFECLTGELPYGERSSVSAILAHVRERPRDVRKLRKDVPRWLALIIARLLEKNAARRYATAREVADAIRQQRAPVNWRRLGAIAILVATIALVALTVQRFGSPERKVSVADKGNSGFRVVDDRGQVLWSRDDTQAYAAALVRSRSRGKDLVAFVPIGSRFLKTPERSRMVLAEAVTGSPFRTVELPDADEWFPSFVPEFGVFRVVTVDLDHDGDDEVLVTYGHIYYPCYTVYYDPNRDQARVIYAASGLHRFVGQADVDRDGRDEVMLLGVNNRMGWYTALAAVSVEEASVTSRWGFDIPPALSPDIESVAGALRWYALLPQRHFWDSTPRVDGERRVVELKPTRGPTVSVGFDGFVVEAAARTDAAKRAIARERAYTVLRAASRDGDGRRGSEEALTAASTAVEFARNAEDRVLLEWATRVRGRLLARAGRVGDALALLDSPSVSSDAAPDFQYDVATELHHRGDLNAAVDLYVRGAAAKKTHEGFGRFRYEFVEGAVFALCELGQFDRASAVIREFDDGPLAGMATYRNYIALLTHRRRFDRGEQGTTDLSRYLRLEIEAAEQGGHGDLLRRVEEGIARNDSVRGGYESLAGELHRQAGDEARARKFAGSALRWIEARREESLFARTYAQLVARRAADAGVQRSGDPTP